MNRQNVLFNMLKLRARQRNSNRRLLAKSGGDFSYGKPELGNSRGVQELLSTRVSQFHLLDCFRSGSAVVSEPTNRRRAQRKKKMSQRRK